MAAESGLIADLRAAVGRRHLLTRASATRPYRMGYRVGGGAALAVVRPAGLVEMWRVLEACCRAGAIVIVQAANTGLTGGSMPFGDYDRPVVIVSTRRIPSVIPVNGRSEAVCLAGATLIQLERMLAPLGRTPHSVIGSSCIGASVIGGVCNNSGGALVRRGPAFTTMALYASVGEDGRPVLHNRLGFAVGGTPEEVLGRLDRGAFGDRDFVDERAPRAVTDYADHLRQVDASTPARFNADPARLHGASGSAGKVMVFAVRVPTFPAPRRSETIMVGADDPAALAAPRWSILRSDAPLPSVAEYVHRDAVRLVGTHGRDVCLALRLLGAGRIGALFAAKRAIDRAGDAAGVRPGLSERMAQRLAPVLPAAATGRVAAFLEAHEHTLLITAEDDAVRPLIAEVRGSGLRHLACSTDEAAAAFRVRFAVAAAGVRLAATQEGAGPLVALDLALARNDGDWAKVLPPSLSALVERSVRYGHFLCNVFHWDFVLRRGADGHAFEREMVDWLETMGARCPAEHGFGHVYRAPAEVADFHRALDPGNVFNPGIGLTSRQAGWR